MASSSQPSRLCEQESQGTDYGSVHFRLQSNEEVMMVLKTEVTFFSPFSHLTLIPKRRYQLKFTKTEENIFAYLSSVPRTSLPDARLHKLKAKQAPGSDHLPAASHIIFNLLFHGKFKVP